MSTVQEIESAIARLSPDEIRQLAAWLETFLEDQLEVRPEFLERLDQAVDQLARGNCSIH